MNRILVVTLGGTICSANKGDTIKLGAALDRSFFDKFKSNAEFSFLTPVLYSSENANEDLFRKALSAIIKECEGNKPDGILILHGTDSMAYFAQLAVRVLSYLNLPVVITGSKLPPEDSHSDAVKNVKYALGLLKAAADGKLGSITFGVVFSDSLMGDTTFIPAIRVTDANFEGDYGKFPGKPSVDTLTKDEAKAYLESPLKKMITIPAIPGFPYDAIKLDDIDTVLIEGYHSGTASTIGLPELVEAAVKSSRKVYIAPVHSGKVQYESNKVLEEKGAKAIYNMPFEGCWAESLIR